MSRKVKNIHNRITGRKKDSYKATFGSARLVDCKIVIVEEGARREITELIDRSALSRRIRLLRKKGYKVRANLGLKEGLVVARGTNNGGPGQKK